MRQAGVVINNAESIVYDFGGCRLGRLGCRRALAALGLGGLGFLCIVSCHRFYAPSGIKNFELCACSCGHALMFDKTAYHSVAAEQKTKRQKRCCKRQRAYSSDLNHSPFPSSLRGRCVCRRRPVQGISEQARVHAVLPTFQPFSASKAWKRNSVF